MDNFKGYTYSGMHVYLWRIKSDDPCHCGRPSQQWAHTNTCTETRWGTTSGSGPREMAWCRHAYHYVRMCRACHRASDANRRAGHAHSAETRAKISAALKSRRSSARADPPACLDPLS